jgi:hypothetical protein
VLSACLSWTISYSGPSTRPPGTNGQFTRGHFVSAPDANGLAPGASHDLLSPAFSTAGASEVWLHANVSTQLLNNAVFDIDVSTDGGVNWNNVFQRVFAGRTATTVAVPTLDNIEGFVGRLHVNLSTVAKNQPSVRLRFRSFDSSNSWWISMDDITVSDSPEGQRGGATEILAVERFAPESGFPPPGWRVRGKIHDDPAALQPGGWNNVDPTGRYNPALAFGRSRNFGRIDSTFPRIGFALIDTSACGYPPSIDGAGRVFPILRPVDEYLITKTLDASAYSTVYLHFDSEILNGSKDTATVLVSFDGGQTFQSEPISASAVSRLPDPVFTFDGASAVAESSNWYGRYVLAVPGAGHQSRLAFAFHLASAPQLNGAWAVDNVRVTGDR